MKWAWIRDSYDLPVAYYPIETRSFSLGRTQMLWWTFIILIAWFNIVFATGNWASFNETALIVMGISVGTAVGAVTATPPHISDKVKALQGALDEQTRTKNGDSQAIKAAEQKVDNAKSDITTDNDMKTKNFWKDLLSDYDDSSGLHRLQNILFTIIIGVYFAWTSFSSGSMPALSSTLLALMGISSSAYVGFKMAGK